MKTNFRVNNPEIRIEEENTVHEKKILTKEEFEKFVIESGAKGSFMIYRSLKKDDELGIDEL